ncbi:glycosyltransferase family protein [Croceibacterium ferulae]|uniref:glycosyltransferase family protein n=1 Tax=Croceibacterium ferulae TaxID=1854641 RepID=UPI000EAEB290|nr:glycosyltransferase [Croceibacterium ferulae]
MIPYSPAAARPLSGVFLFDLIQDVSVLRPIVRILAAETDLSLCLLVSELFTRRDMSGLWYAELEELAEQAGAQIARFDSPFAAVQHLQERRGLLFSASETNLRGHATNHNVFLAAPPAFTRITIQHGHECVGFNQNREQTLAHGSAVRFAADVICGWTPVEEMRHLCASERNKYFELGPPLLLNRLIDQSRPVSGVQTGLVCENLHSVRMKTTGDFQMTYLETLLAFAHAQADEGRQVALRPHPGGQFVLKNKIALPDNVVLANNPMYKTDLQRFAYGISAPSSVLIDMVLAGIPTAVWTDVNSVIDISGYAGLTTVSTLEDWTAFADAAVRDPEPIRKRQAEFLRRMALNVSPALVRDRLLALVRGLLAQHRSEAAPVPEGSRRRVLLVANGVIPSLHISFLKPLQELEQAGRVSLRVLTEKDIVRASGKGKDRDPARGTAFALSQVEEFQPDIAVFCRYSGPDVEAMVTKLKASRVPVIFHSDDDLLNVPIDLGEKKFIEHNRVERTSTIRFLIEQADFVYCSTPRLRERFVELGFNRDMYAGKIYCSRDIFAEAEMRPVRTIGFMGYDNRPELTRIVPVLADILAKYPEVRFELFGAMALPADLVAFGDRAVAFPPIADYDLFVERFHQMQWDIGLCPVHPTPFNVVKADTKWVDYTSIGTAVVASRGTAYDICCQDGCGLLVETVEDWREALESLIERPQARYDMVRAAQKKVREHYSQSDLTRQVLEVFDLAQAQVRQGQA